MLAQQPLGVLVGCVGQLCLLLVAHPLRLFRQRIVVGPHRSRGDDGRHPVLEDHRAGEGGHLLEIVGGAVGDTTEDDLLRGAAGEIDLQQVLELLGGVQIALLARQVQRVAECLTAGDDRHLLHGDQIADQVRHQRMSTLMVSEDSLLLLRDDSALL